MNATDRAARRAVFTGFAIQGFTFASLATRLPEVKDDFGLEDIHILLLLAAVALASGLGSLLAGWYAVRRGSAATFRRALVLASMTVVLPSLMPDVASLVLATCVYGVFLGAVDAAMNMQGVAVQDRYGRPIMTGFHAMWSAAAVLGAVLASVTLELDLGLFASMAVVSVVGLAVNALLLGTLLEHAPIDEGLDRPDQQGRLDQQSRHVPWWPVLLIAVPTTAMWLTDSATSVWSGIYLTDGLDTAASAAPIAYAAYQLVLLLVRLVGDRLVARYGAVRVIRASGLVSTVAVALVVWAPALPVVYVGFGLLGGGLALVPPLSYVAAAHHDVEGGSTAVARINLANYAGYLLAAFTIALVAEAAGNRWMFVVPLVVVPLLPLLASRFEPRVRQPVTA
jgi:MFS family permease